MAADARLRHTAGPTADPNLAAPLCELGQSWKVLDAPVYSVWTEEWLVTCQDSEEHGQKSLMLVTHSPATRSLASPFLTKSNAFRGNV